MIPLADIALTNYISTAFPNLDIKWSPKDSERDAAYTTPNTPDDDLGVDQDPLGSDSRGKGRITVFRTAIKQAISKNKPRSHIGVPTYHYDQAYEFIDVNKLISNDVSYNVTFFSYSTLEITDIQRTLSYYSIYNPVTVITTALDGVNIEWKFTLDLADPEFSFVSHNENDSIRIYMLDYKITLLDVLWIDPGPVRTVKKIFIDFYEKMTDGNDILLDELILIPDPWI